MSDQRLPEDPDQWPIDPFVLLGVNHGSTRKVVRRAYARLIRVYKPEHFPKQFRRIRDAYELLDQRLAWLESSRMAETESGSPAESPEIAATEGSREASENEGIVDVSPTSERATSQDQIGPWQKARQGELTEAYHHCALLAQQGGADEGLFVRLYWMLRLATELEPARDARDWLVAGLRRCGFCGRLFDLYRRELLDDPQEALQSRCDEVIGFSGHRGLLAELVIARWNGAAKRERWDIIAKDLAELRGRMQNEPSVWGRLLLAAIDHLAWSKQDEPREVLAACQVEVELLAEHWLPIAGELDQRDTLLELVHACDQLRFLTNLPTEWRKSLRSLISSSWNKPLESYRRCLIEVLAPLVQNPILGMEWLDRLAARCSPALHRFGTLILALANDCLVGQEVSSADLQGRLVLFLMNAAKGKLPNRWRQWAQVQQQRDRSGRVELLMFCLQERITVRALTEVLASSERTDLAQFLPPANSASLHLICLAYRAFWA
jgi:hypothetical protein